MEVGTEISQKIRSAIKAKLMELGAYVDDELPDYIMVMVANKKNKSQMKTDLSLFLGANTDTFTSWLHGLLGKLQTISVDPAKDKSEKSKKEKKKDKAKGNSETQKSKKSGKEKSRKRRSSKDGLDDAPKAKSAMPDTVPSVGQQKENASAEVNNEAKDSESSEMVDKDCTGASKKESFPVADPKSKDVDTTSVKQTHHVQEEVEDVRQLLVATTPGDDLAKELDAVEEEISNVKKSSVVSHKQASNKAMTSSSVVATGDLQHVQKAKRKVPSSVVANVIRDEDDEEYDPFNPAVGNVASVVKVTSRKASFPPSMQANRHQSSGDGMMLNDSWHDQQQLQMEDDAPQLVSLEFVKVALSEVLENFQFNRQQDGIGSLCQFVECTLRQLGHNDFVQAKSQILQVLASFDTDSCSTSTQHTSSVNKSSNGETGLLAKNTKGPRLGDTPFDGMMTARDPERVIFNSKSSKSPVLPLTNQGSEFYQKFVSSVLKPTSQQAQAEGNSSNAQDGSNTPTQPLVSSTKLESESPRAGLAGSNSKSKTIFPMSTSSPSKPTHVLSPSSTSSPPVAHSAVTSKASAVDLGFHRLRSQILVDSLHVRRKPDSATSSPSTSLLQHAWKKRPSGDKSEGDLDLGESGTNSPSSLSPLHYSGEALKVLAKNLRVTIINRQAKGVEESSSGDDSSSDDDSDEEDSSDANKETEEATDNPEKTPL